MLRELSNVLTVTEATAIVDTVTGCSSLREAVDAAVTWFHGWAMHGATDTSLWHASNSALRRNRLLSFSRVHAKSRNLLGNFRLRGSLHNK